MEINSQALELLTNDFLSRGGVIDTPTAVWSPEGRGWMSLFSAANPNKALIRPAEPAISTKRHRRSAEAMAKQREEADERRAVREAAYNERIATLRRYSAEGKSRLEAMVAAGIKENKTLGLLMVRHNITFKDGRVTMAEAKRKLLAVAVVKDRAAGRQWPEVAKRNGISINTARRIFNEAHP